MERVIVTVKRAEEGRPRDLEVPADLESERLAAMIAEALDWNTNSTDRPDEYGIWAKPPGRKLAPRETLAEVGAWDGAELVFQRPGTISEDSDDTDDEDDSDENTDGDRRVVKGWLPLGLDLPNEPDSGLEQASSDESRFAWKQLD